jgi:hypothetical protein
VLRASTGIDLAVPPHPISLTLAAAIARTISVHQDAWMCITCVRTQLLQDAKVKPVAITDALLDVFFNDPLVDWRNVGITVGSPGFCLRFEFGALMSMAIASPGKPAQFAKKQWWL